MPAYKGSTKRETVVKDARPVAAPWHAVVDNEVINYTARLRLQCLRIPGFV